MTLTLSVLPALFAVCRLEPDAPLPAWAAAIFFSITRTPDELSIVCPQAVVPNHVRAEAGWRLLKVEGPLDFALTGVLASLANPLAAAHISLFAVSTFNTDYLLVKAESLAQAVRVLRQAGHRVHPFDT
ncbi:MAG: ACT domain-containing protein [Anaerolineae bacterium]